MTKKPIVSPARPADLKPGDHFMTGGPHDGNAVWVVADAPVREFSHDRLLMVQVFVQGPGSMHGSMVLRADADVRVTTHRPISLAAPEPEVSALRHRAAADALEIERQRSLIAAFRAELLALQPDEDDDAAEDGRIHFVGDDCLAEHYEDNADRIVCGADFMAGTICSLRAGHTGPDSATCLDCGGDWMLETCTCEVTPPDDER